MLRAVAEAVAEKGYARVTVADVISGAGVSRETFYEHFADKEACFIAALDEGAGALLGILSSVLAHSTAQTPLERLGELLKAYLNTLAAEPAFAKAFLIDAYGAGPRATERRFELQQGFVDLVAELFDAAKPKAPNRFACEALVAAMSSMVTTRVGGGRFDELPTLREPFLELARRLIGESACGGCSSRPWRSPRSRSRSPRRRSRLRGSTTRTGST
jgi:TetR/AcrR family transcriptional regulator